jgi:hypothetical protein
VREESQLDEMRAAIRGDFERLERRRGGQELMHVAEPGSDDEPDGTVVHDERDEPEPEQVERRGGDTEPTGEDPDTAPAEQPARSWLARLLGH